MNTRASMARSLSRPPATAWGRTLALGLALFVAWVVPARGQTNLPAVQIPSLAAGPLQLGEVLASVTNQYPPLLAALIERDIAAGRLRSAQGVFDFQTFAKGFATPSGYYNSWTLDAGFEQFLGIWGATVFGGYRLSRGDALPDYNKNRTESSGEPRIGLRIPLLRDGSIDRRRAAVLKARLDQELADPFILRQQLDFIRAATVAYYNWVASGQRLQLAESLLRVANERGQALTNQSTAGLVPRIILTDNQRLIVSRELAVVQARRRFEMAALALSLFLRDGLDNPVVAARERLPAALPEVGPPDGGRVPVDIETALVARPEARRIRLSLNKAEVDRRLARNALLPNLDAGIQASKDFGDDRYKDLGEFELEVGAEFKMPLQRRDAQGRLQEAEAAIERLGAEEQFARDRIAAEVRDAFSAWQAAFDLTRQTRLNVELAAALQEAEKVRFEKGAVDLLALQIREQATFDAEVLAVEAAGDYFRAQADYRASTAADARALPSRPRR